MSIDTRKMFMSLLSGETVESIGCGVDTKLTREEWEYIEKPVSVIQDQVLKLMTEQTEKSVVETFVTIDNTKYAQYRTLLREFLQKHFSEHLLLGRPESKEQEKKKNPKKKSKKEMIIEKNMEKNMNSSFDQILETFYKRPTFILKTAHRTEPVEFILFRLMLACDLTENWTIISIRTLLAAEKVEGISSLAVRDTKDLVNFIKLKISFSYEKLNDSNPANFLGNYSLISSDKVNLYPFQKEFIQKAKSNKDVPYILKLNAMIGQGKTMISSYLACQMRELVNLQFAKWRTNKNPDSAVHTAQMYFICAVTTVRTEVAKYCYSQQWPYSIATWDFAKCMPKITPANICKKTFGTRHKKKTIIIEPVRICDPLSGLFFLKSMSQEELEDKIVFLDEPTICADQSDSFISKIIVNIMPLARQIVWSSATLPRDVELNPILDNWKTRYPEGKLIEISAMESKIGCQLISTCGKFHYPHTNCKNSEDVYKILVGLKKNPFLCRLYTTKAVFELRKNLVSHGIDAFSIEKELDSTLNLSHTKMIECCIKLLEQLKGCDDEIIQKVCLEDSSKFDSKISPCNLCTDHKNTFQIQTLVATNNPTDCAKKMLVSLIEKKKGDIHKYISILKKVTAEYENQKEFYDKQLVQIQKRYKEKSRIDAQMENFVDPKSVDLQDLKYIVDPHFGVDLFNIISYGSIHEWLKICLMAGIGIYSSDRILSKEYKTLVSSLASQGKLRFVIIDDSVIYGTDWPVGNVICLDDMANSHSILSLIQLFGRAGRINRCYTANAFASNSVLERILDYILNDRVSVEGPNMVNALEKFREFEANFTH